MSWLRCSACKRDLNYGVLHWVCSVSTCNRHNTNYKFCSVACWDSHVATLRHRDAWAVEARAPSRDAAERDRDLTATVELKSPVAARPAPAPVVRAVAPAAPTAFVRSATTTTSGSTPGGSAPGGSSPSGSPAGSSGGPGEPARRLVPVPTAAPTVPTPVTFAEAEAEILIVVSKMKKYIRERSGFNTSDAVADELSEHVRAICDDAIRTAAADGRKTVLDRDVPRVRR